MQKLPVLPGPERVQLTGAAHGDDQQQPADQAAHRCRGDDLAGQDDGAVELVGAVLAVHLAVTAPALKHAPAEGTKGSLLLEQCEREIKVHRNAHPESSAS